MSKHTHYLAACSLAMLLPLGAAEPTSTASAAKTEQQSEGMANPVLSPSDLPFAYPRFDQVKVEQFKPAYEAAMAEHLREVEAIAENKEEPSFENTLVALEKSGRALGRVARLFGNLNSTHTNPAMQAVEKEMAPRLSAHSDAIRLNPKLFARIEALHARIDTLGLDPESRHLLDKYHKDFVRSGAKLDAASQARMRELNKELATLQTTFAQNVLKEVNASALLIDTREELDGLPEAAIAAAAAEAKKAGHEGKYLLRLVNTTSQDPLSQLSNRSVRERLYKASVTRGSRGGDFDNTALVPAIVAKRAERSRLLGFDTFAAFSLEDQTAGTPAAVNALLSRLAPAAVANAQREGAAIQELMNAELKGAKLEAWDWAYYAEKVRVARYAFDDAELKPYFEMNRVLRDGVFFAATKLYGITFRPRPDLPKYHPDTEVWEVLEADGSHLAVLIVDWYARPTKKGGAWANAYVQQSGLLGEQPVVGNHLNLPKPAEGLPTLMTFDEVVTAFHEFGHNLHAIFSNVRYPRFAGTSVPRDFVEFPSQVNEMWADHPETLANYAKHWKTGEPIPAALLAKIEAAAKFNQGYKTTEYLSAALLDQAWHQLPAKDVPTPDGVLAFEAAALRKVGLDYAPVPPRYRTPYFSHIFSLGYSAGYYSYIWAEVLDADAAAWIRANGGLSRTNGQRLRETVLSRGGSGDVSAFYRAFRGQEAELGALLERRGLKNE